MAGELPTKECLNNILNYFTRIYALNYFCVIRWAVIFNDDIRYFLVLTILVDGRKRLPHHVCGGVKMLTQIIFLLLAIAVVVLVVELSRQLGWLRRTIDAASSRKALQDQEESNLLRDNRLNLGEAIKVASRLLKEANLETPAKRSRKQPEKKSTNRSKQKSKSAGPFEK